MKMIKFNSNIPELDKENASLMIASEILEQLTDQPGVTLPDFQRAMALKNIPDDEQEELMLAAISIETMMSLNARLEMDEEPTVH